MGRDNELELRALASHALRCRDIERKIAAARALREVERLDQAAVVDADSGVPGRPAQPVLVEPARVAKRSIGTAVGRAALLHALAHIEFNAVNLALDAIARFGHLPDAFYRDWVGVAAEEALHFSLLRQRLQACGYNYGDFPAHDGLWAMAQKTKHDVLARMALVPRTLEARGLDASPAIAEKLLRCGDHESAAVVQLILRDEIGHVRIGNHWFRFLCAQRGVAPMQAYAQLATQYAAPPLRGPFNLAARRAAGFTDDELALL